jgi:hypothetical protein
VRDFKQLENKYLGADGSQGSIGDGLEGHEEKESYIKISLLFI